MQEEQCTLSIVSRQPSHGWMPTAAGKFSTGNSECSERPRIPLPTPSHVPVQAWRQTLSKVASPGMRWAGFLGLSTERTTGPTHSYRKHSALSHYEQTPTSPTSGHSTATELAPVPTAADATGTVRGRLDEGDVGMRPVAQTLVLSPCQFPGGNSYAVHT